MRVTLLPFSLRYKKDILKISENEIGKNFIDVEYINFFQNNENAKGIVAVFNGEAVGFSFFQWCSVDALLQYIFIQKKLLKNIFKNEKLIGYRNLTAVKKDFQNMGIGGMLVDFSIKELEKKTNTIANVVWKSGNKITLKNSLVKHGLKRMKTISNYWKNDSLRRKYECAFCGLPPCKCTAEIYVKV